MNYLKKLTIFSIFFVFFQSNLLAEVPYFVDFKYILNQSNAGKQAQTHLKKKLDNGIKALKNKENHTRRRKNVIQQKSISAEEYKKSYQFKKKSFSLQKKEIKF